MLERGNEMTLPIRGGDIYVFFATPVEFVVCMMTITFDYQMWCVSEDVLSEVTRTNVLPILSSLPHDGTCKALINVLRTREKTKKKKYLKACLQQRRSSVPFVV
eukprot:scaffold12726_cov148-Cylindrotheca_fusiformis.AAC.2